MRRLLLAVAPLALLAGCGSVTPLRPTKDMTAVPKTPAPELMTPSTQAQPDRQADLLSKSVERKADPFALPPGPTNGRAPLRDGDAPPLPQPDNSAP